MSEGAIERRTVGEVAQLILTVPDKKLNVLTGDVMKEFHGHVTQLSQESGIKAVMLMSGKKGSFIAGADIHEIQALKEPAQALAIVRKGQAILNQLAALRMITVAVIEGVALGGGLELALACDFILVSDHEKTQLGLPEVNLGIIPGFGGTQRLPRKVGLKQGLPMIVSGKSVNARKALKIGLADHQVSSGFFHEEALAYTQSLIRKNRIPSKCCAHYSQHNRMSRQLIKFLTKKSIMAKTKGKYPAPLVAMDVAISGVGMSLSKGLDLEANRFSELAVSDTAKQLQILFFASENLKKYDGGVALDSPKVRPISQAGVLGAGLMGGGIAWLLTKQHIRVRVHDLNWDAIQKSYAQANKINNQLLKIRKIKPYQKKNMMGLISGTTSLEGFRQSDIVIEAIVEDMAIKKAVFEDLESTVREDAILASNTSSLAITEMASGLQHPERFLGLHFFSPVNRMPLVEVIPGEHTSPDTVFQVVKFAQRCGKFPIVVQDCPGFLVNRILLPYINEAIRLFLEGHDVLAIDREMELFGMPIGPLALLDEVGFDVGLKVSRSLIKGYGDRMRLADGLSEWVHDYKILGKKSGRGFYIYEGKHKRLNSDLNSFANRSVPHPVDLSASLDRMLLIMVNEAARCLDEKVVASPELLDMAMVLGTGFPPFLGGLCRYADQRGMDDIYQRLKQFQGEFGDRFEVAPLLETLYKTKGSFYVKGEVR